MYHDQSTLCSLVRGAKILFLSQAWKLNFSLYQNKLFISDNSWIFMNLSLLSQFRFVVESSALQTASILYLAGGTLNRAQSNWRAAILPLNADSSAHLAHCRQSHTSSAARIRTDFFNNKPDFARYLQMKLYYSKFLMQQNKLRAIFYCSCSFYPLSIANYL